MKYKVLAGVAGLLLACSAVAQSGATYRNDAFIIVPPLIAPNIDAGTFINNGQFVINFTNDLFIVLGRETELGVQADPYETQNTLNFTNLAGAFMSCNTGFRFDFAPPDGPRRRASSFYNAGTVNMATPDTTNYLVASPFFPYLTTPTTRSNFFVTGVAGAKGSIMADNLINPGVINLGFESVLRLQGSSIDLSHGTIFMEDQGTSLQAETLNFFFDGGIFDGYWGIGDVASQLGLFYPNGISPQLFFESTPPFTPVHPVQERNGATLEQQLVITNALTYLRDEIDATGTNRYVRCVFIGNTNQDIGVNVYFQGTADGLGAPDILLQYTNLTGATSNSIWVPDYFGVFTNFYLLPNGISGNRVTTVPFNFFQVSPVSPVPPFFLPPPELATTIPPGTFNASLTTNQWAAYEALLLPTSVVLTDIGGRNPTNVPGRIDIEADNYLDLSHSHISSLNHLLLEATNHFVGSPDSRISSPLVDINLRSTNGLIEVTNLLATTIGRPEGTIDLYAARWTNTTIFANGSVVTNHYHVLFADSRISGTSPSRAQDLILRTTGAGDNDTINIYDAMYVTRSFLLDAARITIETNGPGAQDKSGGILLTDPGIVWSSAAPRLQWFTNSGFFQTFNAVYFGGSQTSPYSPPVQVPYQAFVNNGTVTNFGSQIQANFFLNDGVFHATGGSIDLTSQTSILTNGIFLAPQSRISITANNLQVSNHLLQALGPITLSTSYYLDDGTITAGCPDLNTNKNFWTSSGFNLLKAPTYASLQSTTITNFDLGNSLVVNTWAGADKGNSPSGFDNNAAVGRLILDGRDPGSTFSFVGASGNNAIYVDYLEFDDYTTNNSSGVWRQINIASNMKVYFAQAVQNGVSIAEKLDGANGGRFQWVRSYNCGFFSSTNIVYPDGSTNRVNTALATSCNIDSDGDGIVNCLDLSPVPPAQLGACPCNSQIISIPTSFTASTGSGSGPGSGSSTNSGSKLGFPTVAGSGQTNPVAFASGSYSGLFYDTNGVAIPSSGYLTAITTTRGTYTGKLSMGGHAYSFSGAFDSTGQSSTTVSRGIIRSLTLRLQLDSAANQIRGSVTDGHWTAALMADKLVFSKATHASQAGAYTFIIPGDSQDAGSPGGISFGSVSVDTSGNVTWSGALADGSKVTQKSTLSSDGIWPLYSSLYSGQGCVMGWIQFSNLVSGDLVWIKSSGASGKYYSAGFTNLLSSYGSPYQKPSVGARALDLSGGLGEFSANGGGLSQTLTNDIRLELNNRVTSLSGPKLSITITPSSGLFRGTFVNPDTHASTPFQGVLFQNANIGVGYFLGSDGSGEVHLGPPQ